MLQKRFLIILIVFFLFCRPYAWALDGWLATQWGMTPDQVKTALGSMLYEALSHEDEGDPRLFKVKDVKISGVPFNADLIFSKKQLKLNGVILSPSREEKDGQMLYYFVHEQLTIKYGRPVIDEKAADSNIRISKATWTAGATVIILRYIQKPGDPTYFTLEYYPIEDIAENL